MENNIVQTSCAATKSTVRDRRYRMKLAGEEIIRFTENSHGGTEMNEIEAFPLTLWLREKK